MNYRVVWRQRVRNNIHTLAHLAYEMGRDADALSSAVADIELTLSDEPAEVGESREGAERVFIVNPLTVVYEVFEDAGAVVVYEAVYHPRQRL